MAAGDLAPVFDLQCRAHESDYHEPRAALASRFDLGREACLVAELGRRPLAYLLAHPWAGAPPRLHEPLARLAAPDHLFLHDLAVAPEARGIGAAGALVAGLIEYAGRSAYAEIRLVALAGADGFWLRLGWSAAPGAALDRTYGAGARSMRRWLGVA